ncbi:MAG: hypothetical protein IKQ60_06240 [Candidatus Methanomethylophilaceae archaeon]|nr:hypothetical protein [Candidatus Methanomethylophilaceae archaeon]
MSSDRYSRDAFASGMSLRSFLEHSNRTLSVAPYALRKGMANLGTFPATASSLPRT